MSFRSLIIVVVALSGALTARAEQPSPSSSAPQTKRVIGAPGEPAPLDPNSGVTLHKPADSGVMDATGGPHFVAKASQAGLAEVALSKLAQTRASDPQVKNLATQMVQDHRQADEHLQAIAKKSGFSVAAHLDPAHAAKLQALSREQGSAFDQAYIRQLSADHRDAVTLFQQETLDSNRELAEFAGKTLPVLQHHQQMLSSLEQH